jgi:pimeloyl-ACP methyl ester carboxylesterase
VIVDKDERQMAASGSTHRASSGPDAIDIGGRSLHLRRVGNPDSSRPTVVAEAAHGADSSEYEKLLDLLARAGIAACAYDRAGTGASDPPRRPATILDGAQDLHLLLERASLDPPYVLVGHSIGAWYVRAFIESFPEEVAGVVFVDPTGPDTNDTLSAILPPARSDEHPTIAESRDWIEGAHTWAREFNASTGLLDLATSQRLMRGFRDLGDRPVIVLTQDLDAFPFEELPPPYDVRAAAAWSFMQAEFASLSTRGEQRVVPNVDHWIPLGKPEEVLLAIEQVLDALAGDVMTQAKPSSG